MASTTPDIEKCVPEDEARDTPENMDPSAPTTTDQVLSTTASKDALQGPAPYERWIVLAIVCVGILLTAIQSTALVIAFPTLLVQLDASILSIIWVLLSYLVVVSVFVPLAGKLGDIFGQQLLFDIGFLIFGVACLLSGFSQPSANGNDLVGYRCLLGLGGTFLFSNSVAIITTAFLPYGQVGIAQGAYQITFAAGIVVGPIIGGAFAVTDYRWIFWVRVHRYACNSRATTVSSSTCPRAPSAHCSASSTSATRRGPRRRRRGSWSSDSTTSARFFSLAF